METIGFAIKGFFKTTDYFIKGNTQLMSNLTDNEFYPSAERIWLSIRLNNAGKWACNRLADFGKKKKSSFQMKLILIWTCM